MNYHAYVLPLLPFATGAGTSDVHNAHHNGTDAAVRHHSLVSDFGVMVRKDMASRRDKVVVGSFVLDFSQP